MRIGPGVRSAMILGSTLTPLMTLTMSATLPAQDRVDGHLLQFNDNGAWSWFMDERLTVDNGKLLVGSVRASGRYEQQDLPGWGNIELAVHDFKSNTSRVIVLHENLEQDDHNNPGLLKLSDGR